MGTRLRHTWYGDDFTGASDTLATLAGAGLRAMLFLGVPSPRHVAAAGPLDALGIAGAARAMDAAAMRAELEPVARFLASLRAPVCRVAVPDVPIPYSTSLEEELLVTPERIVSGALRAMGR